MTLVSNYWRTGDNHFLVSDNTWHLASGWHTHGGAASTMSPQDTEFISPAMQDDKIILAVIKEFLKRTI